ncbi:hypothetical protein ACQP25_44805 (plasmid) [Microtetraspora malaysiensis]|uniref:hypothetical protein n=1 Tax=Microtetraspora malaysiensis TaxID=161358 RepID=UPI003D8EF354
MTSSPPDSLGGFVLDASALAQLAAPTPTYASLVVDQAAVRGMSFLVPAGALSEAWQTIRAEGGDPDGLADLLAAPTVLVEPLDAAAAHRAGELVAGRHTAPDVAAAHVATCARARGWPALSAAPDRIIAVDPGVPVAKLPGV